MESESTNPNNDLRAIRDIMERSSRFLSLSGLAGIFAGLCALIGAFFAWFFIFDSDKERFGDFLRSTDVSITSGIGLYLSLDAILVLVAAILGAACFSRRKARLAGQPVWTTTTRRLIIHVAIPLLTGGIFILILALRNHLELVASVMLIFYGLSLVNAGKFTFSEIHYLGLTEIALGILAGVFVSQGLLLWTIGFGLMHLLYGSIMYYRYERQKKVE